MQGRKKASGIVQHRATLKIIYIHTVNRQTKDEGESEIPDDWRARCGAVINNSRLGPETDNRFGDDGNSPVDAIRNTPHPILFGEKGINLVPETAQ